MNTNCRNAANPYAPRRKIGIARRSVSGLYPFHGHPFVEIEPVAFESTLERDFLIRTETDRRVLSVISQPYTIEYAGIDGRIRPYTPDYRVIYNAKGDYLPDAIIEVKPGDELRRHLSEWKPKFRSAMRFCKEMGYVFHIVDEARIRDQRWRNAMFLQRYRMMRFEPADTDWIVGNLKAMGTATFDHLLARHFFGDVNRGVGISHLWHLVATNRVACDLTQALTHFTELWIPDD